MRRKLERVNRGQLLYSPQRNVLWEEQEIDNSIGFGMIQLEVALFGGDQKSPVLTLKDLGFSLPREPHPLLDPGSESPYFYLGASEIVISEANQVISEAKRRSIAQGALVRSD